MTNPLDLRDLAEEVADPELDNDAWLALHGLASELDRTVPPDGPGPVPPETVEAVRAALDRMGNERGPLIPEDEFEEYAQEFAESVGAVEEASAWPCCYIDWEKAADDLRGDYSTIDYQGTTYLYR